MAAKTRRSATAKSIRQKSSASSHQLMGRRCPRRRDRIFKGKRSHWDAPNPSPGGSSVLASCSPTGRFNQILSLARTWRTARTTRLAMTIPHFPKKVRDPSLSAETDHPHSALREHSLPRTFENVRKSSEWARKRPQGNFPQNFHHTACHSLRDCVTFASLPAAG
jgi:hypothetical protein